jgi:hypothetical protein
MALIGGGGAGNVAGGSNPSGVGTSLNYVGEHAYAYSGAVSVNGTETTLIEASVSNNYLTLLWDSAYSPNAYSTKQYTFKLYLDEQLVHAEFHYDNNIETMGTTRILIPPYSKVKITAENVTDNTALDCLVTLSGRVYQ